jgi:uncharacterized protein YndB with AHSA1/START domain
MTGNTPESGHIVGSLRSADGKGVVRIEGRVDAGIDEVWSALTDPSRLARWYGEVAGDLRLGGEYRARVFASEWEGTGHVDACEPPRLLRVLGKEPDEPDEQATEVTLATDGDQTVLVVEQRGIPLKLEMLAAYGAGTQVHVEDLVGYLAGRERCDARVRWGELQPAYQDLAANVG